MIGPPQALRAAIIMSSSEVVKSTPTRNGMLVLNRAFIADMREVSVLIRSAVAIISHYV